MKFTGVAMAILVGCAAALPPTGRWPRPPPPQGTPSATPSSSAVPSSSSIAAPSTPSSSASVTPTGYPAVPFDKRQFELPSGFSSLPFPIPTGLPVEKRKGFRRPPPLFPVTPSSSGVPSSTATPSATPSVTPF